MKLTDIMISETVMESTNLDESAMTLLSEIELAESEILEAYKLIDELRIIVSENEEVDEADLKTIDELIDEAYDRLGSFDFDVIEESVDRQFKRYGDTFKRQYRCTSGPKAGRMVASPEKCGIRKDPRRVRIGKKSARMKKGQRVRKSKFTKRKTQSKRLSRMNAALRGDK